MQTFTLRAAARSPRALTGGQAPLGQGGQLRCAKLGGAELGYTKVNPS